MTSDTASYAAASGWLSLGGERLSTEKVELLGHGRNTSVYRLHSKNGAVIAKRCTPATGTLERTIYERLLIKLPLPILRYYGAVWESNREFCWIFIEDAGGKRFVPHCRAHQIAAARWLAALHCSVRNPPGDSLPHRQPDYYRQLLGSVREMLRRQLEEQITSGDDAGVDLGQIIGHCDSLWELWDELADACRTGPDVLIHGDIVTHNARIRTTDAGLVFLPFDWEKAGWGTPAEDLSSVDLEAYCEASAERGDDLDRVNIERLAGAGKAFRCLVFLQWLGPDLATHAIDAAEQLRMCRAWLDAIMKDAPWTA